VSVEAARLNSECLRDCAKKIAGATSAMTKIPSWFECVENHRESIVRELIEELAARTAALQANPELLADIACIALNTLKPRYIHRPNALRKYMTQQERESSKLEAQSAVQSAFEFVLLSSGTEGSLTDSTRDL
jgi:hypothetical protein